jgi:hypothetical protein
MLHRLEDVVKESAKKLAEIVVFRGEQTPDRGTQSRRAMSGGYESDCAN